MTKRTDVDDVNPSNSERYLRVLLQIEIRKMFVKEGGSLKIAEAARFLSSLGCPPTEVANLLGKQKATEVSSYLYNKKRPKGRKAQRNTST